MGDGLQRAALAALLTRSPWSTTDGELDASGLHRVYDAVSRGPNDHRWIVFPWVNSDRRTDKALQLLRKAGLIEFSGKPKRWRITGTVEVSDG